jgi:hypothetical protein
MKKNSQARILLHNKGTGDLTQDDVEKRARELAVIDGRDPETVTEANRAEAWAELSGALLPETSNSDKESAGALSRDPSEPISDAGHEVVTSEPPDDESDAPERLATEGVEEAQHDQMLAAREREHREQRS